MVSSVLFWGSLGHFGPLPKLVLLVLVMQALIESLETSSLLSTNWSLRKSRENLVEDSVSVGVCGQGGKAGGKNFWTGGQGGISPLRSPK